MKLTKHLLAFVPVVAFAVGTLLMSFACAQKAKPIKVAIGDMYEERDIKATAQRIREESEAHNKHFAEWKQRLTDQYGINWDKGDDVDSTDGHIMWHVEAPKDEPKKEEAKKADEKPAAKSDTK